MVHVKSNLFNVECFGSVSISNRYRYQFKLHVWHSSFVCLTVFCHFFIPSICDWFTVPLTYTSQARGRRQRSFRGGTAHRCTVDETIGMPNYPVTMALNGLIYVAPVGGAYLYPRVLVSTQFSVTIYFVFSFPPSHTQGKASTANAIGYQAGPNFIGIVATAARLPITSPIDPRIST